MSGCPCVLAQCRAGSRAVYARLESVPEYRPSNTLAMTDEYLLAWNDHHSTFFTAMSELVSGDVLTDVTVWAGQTLYTAHRLVLALSSSYFKLVLTGAARGRLPVIFLKDVSSKDFERLLSYMYHGEVSVPQSELLSLIAAARSLGIRGLAEELPDTEQKPSDRDVKVRDTRGLKREAEDTAGKKKLKQLAWSRQEVTRAELEQSEQSRTQEPHLSVSYQEASKDLPPLRPHNDNGKENDTKPQEKTRDDEKSRSCEKDSNGKEGSPGKNFSPFLEVNVKQEEEDPPSEDNNAISESPDFLSPPPLSLVRRTLLPALLPNTRTSSGLTERRTASGSSALLSHNSGPGTGAVTRSTGTCHFCGRSFMKNKQLMNHVCPMRPTGK